MINNIKDFLKTHCFQLENKNQFVIEYIKPNNFSVLCFQSYKTLICVYDYETKQLYINWSMWDYSKTTMKHLKIFINRFTIFNYENKQQFIKEITTNNLINTFKE